VPRPKPPLLDLLERHGRADLILPAERLGLERPDVVTLSSTEQLEWLRTNRKVGLWVTAFAGGVRLLLLAGGAVACLGFALGELLDEGVMNPLRLTLFSVFGFALTGVSIWLGRGLRRRLRELRRPLPFPKEIGL
jgi:hypothetical protein